MIQKGGLAFQSQLSYIVVDFTKVIPAQFSSKCKVIVTNKILLDLYGLKHSEMCGQQAKGHSS